MGGPAGCSTECEAWGSRASPRKTRAGHGRRANQFNPRRRRSRRQGALGARRAPGRFERASRSGATIVLDSCVRPHDSMPPIERAPCANQVATLPPMDSAPDSPDLEGKHQADAHLRPSERPWPAKLAGRWWLGRSYALPCVPGNGSARDNHPAFWSWARILCPMRWTLLAVQGLTGNARWSPSRTSRHQYPNRKI
jgi:hypothetical protein